MNIACVAGKQEQRTSGKEGPIQKKRNKVSIQRSPLLISKLPSLPRNCYTSLQMHQVIFHYCITYSEH